MPSPLKFRGTKFLRIPGGVLFAPHLRTLAPSLPSAPVCYLECSPAVCAYSKAHKSHKMSAEADPTQRVAIGISFGNSYSSIAFTSAVSPFQMQLCARRFLTRPAGRKGRGHCQRGWRYVAIVPSPSSFREPSPYVNLTLVPDRQIPSILSYVEGEELHAGQAKGQLVRNTKNTVAYFRDFLGQEYAPPNASIKPALTSLQVQVDRPHPLPPVCAPHTARVYHCLQDPGRR